MSKNPAVYHYVKILRDAVTNADCKNQYLVRADGTIRNVGYVEITKFTVFANNIKEARAIARKKRLLNKKEAA
jgi:hypothetical protein